MNNVPGERRASHFLLAHIHISTPRTVVSLHRAIPCAQLLPEDITANDVREPVHGDYTVTGFGSPTPIVAICSLPVYRD